MIKLNLRKFIIYFIILLITFSIDRITKIYILNIAETTGSVDIYINSFLNFFLVWNTGIGFGLFSSENNFYYNLISILIFIINIIIIIMIFQTKDYRILFLTMILGGSLGNFFDRIYYRAVPDFIDLHYINFHWFIFNVADIFITIGIICLIIVEFILNNKQLDNETT